MRLFHSLALVCLAVATTPGWTQVSVHINVPGIVQMAPPPPRYEAVPRGAPNQVWVPGRWAWNDRQYAWQPGHLQRARIDYMYAHGQWIPADGGWRWSEETWRPKPKQSATAKMRERTVRNTTIGTDRAFTALQDKLKRGAARAS